MFISTMSLGYINKKFTSYKYFTMCFCILRMEKLMRDKYIGVGLSYEA